VIPDDEYFAADFHRFRVVADYVFADSETFFVFTNWGELKAAAIVERHLVMTRPDQGGVDSPLRYRVEDLGEGTYEAGDLGDRSED
jgi:hypothetical protein